MPNKEKERVLEELEEKWEKVRQLRDYLEEDLSLRMAEIIDDFISDKAKYFMELRCPKCNDYKLNAIIIPKGLTKNRKVCTAIGDFSCSKLDWSVDDVGMLYIASRPIELSASPFSLTEALKNKGFDYDILYEFKK